MKQGITMRNPTSSIRRTLITLALALALSSCAREETAHVEDKPPIDFGEGHARPRLVADVDSLRPGDTFTLGLLFEIEEGWHLYWDGLNDTGLPIAAKIVIPPSFEAGSMLWPAPKRLVSPGAILDHIYEDRVTLLLPLRVPEDAAPGDRVTFVGQLDWVACKEACVLGKGRVELKLPVGHGAPDDATSTSGKFRNDFQEARSRIPLPLDDNQRDVRWAWKGNTLSIDAPEARRLAFYPYQDCTRLEDPIRDGVAEGSRLTLEFEVTEGEPIRASGVLEVDIGRPGGTRFYSLNTESS
jgi:DsbC/DsbD-like thiol-disulfide interchange protein